MKKTMLLASAAIIGVSFLTAPAKAQGVPQAVEITKVDVQKVAAGYRASKVIGSSVLNEANQTIGKIDDLLVTRDGKEPYAVLSVGGFLGMGTRMVVIPYDSLKFADNKIVLPGGTKDGLKMLPAFQYSKCLSDELLNHMNHLCFKGGGPDSEGPPMWTNENRGRYDRSLLRYPSDLTDDEWNLVECLIPPGKRGGDKRTVIMREVVNGLMYILSTGCQWRAIPKDLPPRSTLYDYFDLWSWDGTLDRIHHELYMKCREAASRRAP